MRHARNTLEAGVALIGVLALTACSNDATSSSDAPSPVSATEETTSGTSPGTSSPDASAPRSMEGVDGPLEPGPWIVPFVATDYQQLPRAVVDVPPGYGSPGGWIVDRGADGDPENYGDVGFWTVARVDRDPCTAVTADDPGPGIRDLARALRAQPGHRVTRPRPVTIDGHHGLYLEVRVPDNLQRCHDLTYTLWRTLDIIDSFETDITGTVWRLWILDVDGTRVVMSAGTTPGENAAETAEVVGIAESVHFIAPLQPAR